MYYIGMRVLRFLLCVYPLTLQYVAMDYPVPRVKQQIPHECGTNQGDVERNGQTRISRSNSQAHTGTREYSFSMFS